MTLPISNANRATGTIIGSEITRRYGPGGLNADTVNLNFNGSAGQSFGAFIPHGMTLTLTGDSNDYIGKGLSGGKIIVKPPAGVTFAPEENVIIGNVAFYGATSGEAYISGLAGERFCVRNSGATAVVEGLGDHGCEYMTGGKVVVLGTTGRNFAAGMSGGIAYVLDLDGNFRSNFNAGMADAVPLDADDEIDELQRIVACHLTCTGSPRAADLLNAWESLSSRFIKVYPRDFRRMHEAMDRVQRAGLAGEEAVMAAFSENVSDFSRASGN